MDGYRLSAVPSPYPATADRKVTKLTECLGPGDQSVIDNHCESLAVIQKLLHSIQGGPPVRPQCVLTVLW